MPWKESSALEQRKAFIAACQAGEESVAELCRRYEISRQTGYKWLQRFAEDGEAGLEEKSRAPHCQYQQMLEAVAEEVLWRGAVMQVLADRVGTRTAWVWAAVLYAVAYVPTAWSLRAGGTGSLDPLLPVAALGAGLLWGAMARAWGRLVPGMIAHVFFDWAVVMMFPLWGPR